LLQPAEKAWRDQLPPPSVGTSGELPQYTARLVARRRSPKPGAIPVSVRFTGNALVAEQTLHLIHMVMNANWDASRYHRVAQPHAAWGATVLDRLDLAGDEVVLDAGCGSGRVTAQLLERLPSGRVIAVDQSRAMLAEARTTLARWMHQVRLLEADLLEIDRVLDTPVEIVFSTAVFHWIADHARLFAALRGVLQPGGYLVAQCGGAGNLADFMHAADAVAERAPFASVLHGRNLWRFFYTPAETEARLLAAGFARARAWLEPSPQHFAGPAELADYCRGVVLTSHVAALPEPMRADFVTQVVDEVVTRQGDCVLDYVRLNMDAFA
jgi:trans-aconitate 2-methyltransferase